MNPYIPIKHPATDAGSEITFTAEIYSLGGLGLGGIFGGPAAMAYLIYRDLVTLDRRDRLPVAAVWFTFFTLFWLYCIFSFPPDLISQWLLYFPQTILWWMVASHLLADLHAAHREHGGYFFSRWRGVSVGLGIFIVIKTLFLVGSVGFEHWTG